MPDASVIMYVLKASVALLVVSIGLQTTPRDATYLVRHPGLFARTIVSMHLAMPLATLALTVGLSLPPAVRVALLAMSISPVPPFLPPRVNKAGGDGAYVIGLLVATSLLSVAILPLSVRALGRYFDLETRTPLPAVVKVLLATVLGPLAIGLVIGRLVPASTRFAKWLSMIATIALVVAIVPVLVSSWPAFVSLVGNGTLFAIVAITVIGLASGHLLGGPVRDDRAVLALSTTSRHPAVAIVIATANLPNERLVVPAILLALVVSALVATPYVMWSKRGANASEKRP
jgi:BASS family bile acid:Na+ symporter